MTSTVSPSDRKRCKMAANGCPDDTVAMDVESLRQRLANHNQGHLLDHWSSLSADEKRQLYSELNDIDYGLVNKYFNRCKKWMNLVSKVDEFIEPSAKDVVANIFTTDADTLKAYEDEGKT